MPRRGKDFYRGISFQPHAPVAVAARRALERRAQQPASNRGMTPVGLLSQSSVPIVPVGSDSSA
jgi:hypothetical protein